MKNDMASPRQFGICSGATVAAPDFRRSKAAGWFGELWRQQGDFVREPGDFVMNRGKF